MSLKFTIDFLPATYGDCIWIEYGQDDDVHRVLIDGGTKGTRHAILDRLNNLSEGERCFELIVNTHYDKDHIDGLLGLLELEELPFRAKDIWFNGWGHLTETDEDKVEAFGAVMAEDLSQRILFHKLDWNLAFCGNAVVVPAGGNLPERTLKGGLKLTLLSPYRDNLDNLKKVWREEVIKKGREPGYGMEPVAPPDIRSGIEQFGGEAVNIEALNATRFVPDNAEGNGSSIALLIEYGGKSALLVGDALPSVVLKSLQVLQPEGKLPVDLFKLSHHGSRGNTGPALIEKLDCHKYMISTNGSIYSHPHPESVAWLIKRGGETPEINFNYRTEHNEIWDSDALRLLFGYKTVYPDAEGLRIDLL